ncbi:serine/threonine-protein phosphatase 1-like isoform X1 [Mya arenaria]|uniref:serine/threonine-protein phosphatase 1-like isoform X1 n=2 Tax=Mya arenaria TaxID=6604 RepID=UPI0022E12B41|nr:serine/threonine-protein phosphatase 1-like isoform X1 [Mya arenaria]
MQMGAEMSYTTKSWSSSLTFNSILAMAALANLVWSWLIRPTVPERENFQRNPLPEVCHLHMSDEDLAERSVFVIGDIHGCLEELCELMKAAEEFENNILFVSVGDLVNRGPDSVGVVRKLRNMGDRVLAIRGNHDESSIREARHFRDDPNYELSEKYAWIKNLTEADFRYLNSLPYTISLPTLNSVIVHGGLLPGVSLENQKLNDMTNMRNIEINEDPFVGETLVASNKHSEGEPWVDLWAGPEHVYFGHDARRKLQRARFATGLDTGCCHGGQLTGVFINGPHSQTFLNVQSKQPIRVD